jgi:hypothetical protein
LLTLGFGLHLQLTWREEAQRGSGEVGEGVDSTPAVIGVAIMIAVEEVGSDFPQIASPHRLTTQHTGRLLVRRSVIHQYEFHVAPPGAEPSWVAAATFRLLGYEVKIYGRPLDEH